MKSFYEKYQRNYFSQNGEDGIIEECLKRIGIKRGICAEFGAHNGVFCSNTYKLFKEGWSGRMIEADEELFKECCANVMGLGCQVINCMVTPENVCTVAGLNLNLISIDCDGPDYYIWKSYEGRPDIVVIEINSSVHPESLFPIGDKDQGTAYMPMVKKSIEKGYFLLCHTGNLIFIRNDRRPLFPEIVGDGLENWQEYFQGKWLVK